MLQRNQLIAVLCVVLAVGCDGRTVGGQNQHNDNGAAVCGNGAIEPGEACDNGELEGESCETLGHPGGVLACGVDCQLDVRGCHFCGSGATNPAEECDGTDLAGQTCQDLGFDGGELSCASDCLFDISDCATCGNGVAESGEECDGLGLHAATCASVGYPPGTLACHPDCTYDTSGCSSCDTVSDLVEQTGCGGDDKCTVIFDGTLACRPGGTIPWYHDCDANNDQCQPGSRCQTAGGEPLECVPFCYATWDDAGCPGNGFVFEHMSTAAGWVGMCTEPDDCDAVYNTGCHPDLSCQIVGEGDHPFCRWRGNIAAGGTCQHLFQCAGGTICYGSSTESCTEYCYTTADCILGTCQHGMFPAHQPTIGLCLPSTTP